MERTTRTFRVFVSSTFEDLAAERDALQESVFPRLRDLCARHDAHFQPIDLRWGVPDEACLDHQAMRICLGELARCQRVSPRPNFIVLLGDRYGWRPAPAEVPAALYEFVRDEVATTRQKGLLGHWYRYDDNAAPFVEGRPAHREPRGVYVLRPRSADGPYGIGEDEAETKTKRTAWVTQVEAPLQALFAIGAQAYGLFGMDVLPYVASATHQEIAAGALSVPDPASHVFCFARQIVNLPDDYAAGSYTDFESHSEAGGGPARRDLEAWRRLSSLKADLERCIGSDNFKTYKARWVGPATADTERNETARRVGGTDAEAAASLVSRDHIAKFCEDVYESLARVLSSEFPRLPLVSRPTSEDELHTIDRAAQWTDFATVPDRIDGYLAAIGQGGTSHPLAIWGLPGTGLPSLMARVVKTLAEIQPSVEVICRFIGAAAASVDVRSLLDDVSAKIDGAYGVRIQGAGTSYEDLVRDLPTRLAAATSDKPLVIMLDALHQLSDTDDARALAWLPVELPEHCRIIVSTKPGVCLDALKRKLEAKDLVEVVSSDRRAAAPWVDLLGAQFREAGRRLQDAQWQAVCRHIQACNLPLWRKVAFDCDFAEARRWHSYDPPPEYPENVRDEIRNLFARLARPENHGSMLVERVLGYLACSRIGLAEDELLGVLAADDEFFDRCLGEQSHVHHRLPMSAQGKLSERGVALRGAAAERQVPGALWSRLYYDLEPHLFERAEEGVRLMTFFHRELRDVAASSYLSAGEGQVGTEARVTGAETARHRTLADYFAHRADPEPPAREADGAARRTWAGTSRRAFAELPYHLTRAEEWSELLATLFDFTFIERKCVLVGVQLVSSPEKTTALYHGPALLHEDLRGALERFPDSELESLTCAVEREMRLLARCDLARYPQIVWQQLYNRLQWEVDANTRLSDQGARGVSPAPAETESKRLAAAVAAEFTRRTTPDAPPWLHLRHEAASRDRHAGLINGCAFSPDGRTIVTASWDETLKLWDVCTGAELRSLVGHADMVHGCAFSPDGRTVLSASADGTLKLWDARTGAELRSLVGHSELVNACAFSPDGHTAVSASWDETLKLWDTHTGAELLTFAGHTADVNGCAFSPDGRTIVSASEDNTLKLWDVAAGAERATLAGHTLGVEACAFSPDGRALVSASPDTTLKFWDVRSCTERATLTGHTSPVNACAFSPDGRLVVSVSEDTTLKLWDAGSGEEIIGFHAPGSLWACAFSPLGDRVCCGDQGGNLYVLEPRGALAGTPTAPGTPVVKFLTFGLLSKFGFGDGDMLFDLMDEHDLRVDRSDLLIAVVERFVVPRLDQEVETYTLVSMHNPIRARTIDGKEAEIDSTLTPEVVEVPVADIIRLAHTLPRLRDGER